jgi:2-C-methyl-D-erythritol 4-phosphate cytidylyltransferase
MKVAAVIVAGGTGSRMKTARPKQFVELAGKPLLAYTLSRFERSPVIDRVVLVLPRRGFDDHMKLMSEWVEGVKPVDMVPGGVERQDSTRAGLEALPPDFEGWVAVHDGARPLIESDVITRVVEAARHHGGALAGLPVYETLKEVEQGQVTGTVDRKRFYRAQTPQCFRYDILRQALERARTDGIVGTDESAIVERLGVDVAIVPGSESNLKVTTSKDLVLAKYYLELEGLEAEG